MKNFRMELNSIEILLTFCAAAIGQSAVEAVISNPGAASAILSK